MGCIAQFNKCGLRFEGSEDIASERSENHRFQLPHSHLTPPGQRTPANICINLILPEVSISNSRDSTDEGDNIIIMDSMFGWWWFGLVVMYWLQSTSYSTPGPVNTWMGDRL